MATPLINQSHLKPLLRMLKREGWAALLFILLFVRGMHGLPAAFHLLFSVRRSDIQSYDLVYSRHDVWVLHSGLLSIISAVILLLVIIRWIRFYRNTVILAQLKSNKNKAN